jgi:hypothetical protein
MSTKTLRKRIALVAAAALGAGLLTVVSVPAANADAPNVNINAVTGVATAVKSIGLLGSDGTGLAQSAVLLATGGLSTSYTGSSVTATVTGGRFTAVTATTGTATITGTSSTSAKITTVGSDKLNLLAVPNAGATTMVVSYFVDGTISARISTTIASTSLYNKYSATYSYARWGIYGADFTTLSDATSGNSTKGSSGTLQGEIAIADAYGNPVVGGIVTATVTSGAVVNLDSPVSAGTTTLDYITADGGLINFNVQQDDVDVPWNGTVTIAYNGTVVATKSGVLKGEVASVTVTSPKIGKKNFSNPGAAVIAYADAAGNVLYPASGTSAVSSTMGTIVSDLSVVPYPDSSTTGLVTMLCTNGTMGAVTGLQVQHLNTSGTIVKSNKWDSGCSDVPYTVEASWDRVSYVPGSIATLTLKFKDSKGNLASAYHIIGSTDGSASASAGSSSADAIMTIAGAPSAAAITPIVYTDKPSGVTGIKTYQFVVGSIEGDFVAVIVPTEIKGNNATATNISLPYSVKSASTGVSNADVLKAIVSLIASINKQIAALQKALLKKK